MVESLGVAARKPIPAPDRGWDALTVWEDDMARACLKLALNATKSLRHVPSHQHAAQQQQQQQQHLLRQYHAANTVEAIDGFKTELLQHFPNRTVSAFYVHSVAVCVGIWV